jgi:hypothetical protein
VEWVTGIEITWPLRDPLFKQSLADAGAGAGCV